MNRDSLRRDRAQRTGEEAHTPSIRRSLAILSALLLLALPLAAQDAARAPLHTPAPAAQDDGFGPPPPPATSGPKMVIEHTEFDWGQVLHGEVVEHSYPVRNEGDDVLRITSVKPG